MTSYPITPVPAPRMTRSDKWRSPRRPCVERYFAFRDEVRLRRVEIKDGSHIVFVLPMPEGWSEKKKVQFDGQPHRQRPDKDNLEKALMDSVFDEDCGIHDTRTTKIWGRVGEIFIVPMVGLSGDAAPLPYAPQPEMIPSEEA